MMLWRNRFLPKASDEGRRWRREDFQKLLKEFPNGNAVDNAYSWMAIIYRCAHKADLARKTNMEIIRRFPLTRHAKYAAERMLHPDECGVTAWNSAH